jgi:hypothetical protein
MIVSEAVMTGAHAWRGRRRPARRGNPGGLDPGGFDKLRGLLLG